jgi:hypothetical protein
MDGRRDDRSAVAVARTVLGDVLGRYRFGIRRAAKTTTAAIIVYTHESRHLPSNVTPPALRIA